MRQLPADTIVITGIGMCSSLGNAVMACAAARAGVTMSRELPDFVITCNDGTDAVIVGNPVATAAGFRGMGKLLNLGMGALDDLLGQTDLRSQNLDKTGLYVCLRAPGPGDPPDGDRLCAELVALVSLPVPEANRSHVAEGHAGFVRAAGAASAKLRAGHLHRCLVGGVDSLLDQAVLEALIGSGRLKTPDKPDGLQPGEAGAFVLLERLDGARRREADILAVMAGSSLASEPDHAGSDRPCRGIGLTAALSPLLDDGAEGGLWLVSDHNGEHFRANELGSTRARAPAAFPALRAARPWYPAASFGDTGAASAAIAACMVARAFRRGYAPAASALILSSSEQEPRGALRFRGDVA
jgi:3-oxoacyl-[acyl-carrier-protein] synthase-1